MARDFRFQPTPLAENFDVGDDSDMPGFDQPYTRDDVDELLNSPSASVDERSEALRRMLDDLSARQGMDEAGEFSGLISEVRDALATLNTSADREADGSGEPGVLSFDPDDRVLAPDEILEREEDEAAREAEEK